MSGAFIVLTHQVYRVIQGHSRMILFWIKQWQDVLITTQDEKRFASKTNSMGVKVGSFTKQSLSDRYKEYLIRFKVCHYNSWIISNIKNSMFSSHR